MSLVFKVRRDCDQKKLRKVIIELHNDEIKDGDLDLVNPKLVDRTRMFAGPFFALRLKRRQRRMYYRALTMLARCGSAVMLAR